ncbi:MAG: phosphate acyltransferase, partial [Alphaproteobacteria bacterium]|nr:phosphate acyltransferase [Alphaproteobacteria bacterium]
GIERPALGRAIPTMKGVTCILDLGANLQCCEVHLVHYAMMGAAFAETVIQTSNPSIGLLNIGTEEIKGPASVRHADHLLQKSHLNYHGFIEGADLVSGLTDVIVCDGFSGNIALKTAEGMFSLFHHNLREAFQSNLQSKIGAILSGKAIQESFSRFDPIRLEGAALLGLKKTVVKAHGNTTAKGFSNAIKIALGMGNNHLEKNIVKHLNRIEKIPEIHYHKPQEGLVDY